jgi:hypothetical protein
MTDDQTQRNEPVPDATRAAPDGVVTTPPTVAAATASWGRWVVALGVAAVVIVAGVAVLLAFGKPASPEALAYVPGDAAFVMELRPDMPGDQLQAAGNLLAHFPGFKDQSTLSAKIDEALKRIIAQAPGSSVDYDKDVKPFLSGPMFVAVHSFEDVANNSEPTNMVVVATTTGTVGCSTAFRGQAVTTETYNGLQLSLSSDGITACAIDGRFALVGDPIGVKAAIDAHKGATGLDRNARYAAARTELGLDRLATMYLDGASLAKALPTANPNPAIADLAGAVPQWVMAGIRAENDALVVDIVVSPPSNPAAVPSLSTYPPARPLGFTAFAPADTLAFVEIQGFGVSIRNLLGQVAGDPQLGEALKELEPMGGLDGVVGWIDEAGVIVYREGNTPGGAILLAAADAASASEKVTALETVLGLGALGGDLDVSTSTVEGVKVTTVHVPDVMALAGTPQSGAAPIPLDVSFAAKDRFIIVGIGSDAMTRVLGVKPGAGLADDAAFKRALARGLPNPQVVVYVAAGATIDWLDTAAAELGGSGIPADLKPYLDPLEGFMYTVTGNGVNGSFRMALTVANP